MRPLSFRRSPLKMQGSVCFRFDDGLTQSLPDTVNFNPVNIMKSIRILSVLAVASFLTVAFVRADDTHKEGTKAGCCLKAEKKGEKCGHECCEGAAKDGKNCEKCGGKNEAKK